MFVRVKQCQHDGQWQIRNRLPLRLYILFFFILIAYIAFCCLYNMGNQGDIPFLFYAAIAMGLLLWAVYKAPVRPFVFVSLLMAGSLILKIIFVLSVPTLPRSDFNLLYQTAQEVAKGDVSTLHDAPYFQNWAYQTGFVAWMAVWMRFFPVGISFFQIVNCLWQTITGCLIYGMVHKYAPERAARCACFLYLFYPGHAFLLPILTNQHIATCLAFAALYLFFYAKNLPPLRRLAGQILPLCAGCVLALADAIRPIAIVILLAISAASFVQGFSLWRKHLFKTLLSLALKLSAFVLSFVFVSFLLSALIQASTLNPYGLRNNFPQWKFVVGLNQESGGQYSLQDLRIYKIANRAERAAAADTLIQERLSVGFPALAALAHQKTVRMWTSYEESSWVFADIREQTFGETSLRLGDLETGLLKWSAGYYALLFILTAWGLWNAFRRAYVPPLLVALLSTGMLYIGVHWAIEIQARYREFILPALLALAFMTIPFPADGQKNRRGVKDPLPAS